MIFNPPPDYIIPSIGYTQEQLDEAVEAMRIETLEKAEKAICIAMLGADMELTKRVIKAIRSMK